MNEKELVRRMSEVCHIVKERFRSGSDISISFNHGTKQDLTEERYLKVVPSKEDTIVIEMKG